jgi:HemY protein
MMSQLIRIVVVLIILLITVVLAAMIFDDSGYVMVEFNGWVVEMNVWSLSLSLIAIFVGFMLVNLMVKSSLAAASGSKNWLGNWGSRKKQKAFTAGLIALAETNYLIARENFNKITNEDFDGINLLAAAETEIQLGQPEQAKSYWHMATTYEKSALAANLCLIRDALQHRQSDQAIAIIHNLSEKQQTQTPILKLWAQALGQVGKWQELQGKLKGWKKALGNNYEPLMQQASKAHFAEIASKEGASQLKQNWQALPRATRKEPAQQAAYIQQLIEQGMHADAGEALVEYQKSVPHPLLIPLFKQIKLPNPAIAIKKLEGWLKQDELNVDLFSALGHIAHNSNDKVLAEKALSKAIKLGNRQEDLMLMATIKESQNNHIQALQLYKQSMASGVKLLAEK